MNIVVLVFPQLENTIYLQFNNFIKILTSKSLILQFNSNVVIIVAVKTPFQELYLRRKWRKNVETRR